MFRLIPFKPLRAVFALLIAATASPAAFAIDVRICTNLGIVDVELDERNAPRHARNFARYADSGYYSGTIIHRAVAEMIQAGGYNLEFERRRPEEPVPSEAANGLSNERGTIAASRREDDPDSATSQFYFNLTDNPHLDAAPGSAGYTVFGRVTGGLEVLDAIARQPTRRAGDLTEVPSPVIELESVSVIERAALFGLSVEPDPASLQAAFAAAEATGDPAARLEAVDALRAACVSLDSEQFLAEAESANALGNTERARYSLEQFIARARTADPLLPRAQRLYASLPQPQESNFEDHIAHCRRPAAPTIPDGRFTDRAALAAVESAVVRYKQLGEAYVACIARVIDGGELNDLEIIDATNAHNEFVIELTGEAQRFNQAVREFRATQP